MSLSATAPLPDALREALRGHVDQELGLPLLPETATRVMAACQDENSDLQELAELVTHDQSLAVHILRVANSVAYAPREPILSIPQALGRLGLSTVSDISLAVALKERAFRVPGHEPRIRELWLHSVVSACYAREIAQLLRRNLDSAFLCGLLHDVGMAIVMQTVCDLVPPAGISREVMESAMAEFHCEVGARIAQRWRLGPWIASAIRWHHEPSGARLLQEEVSVIALADELADWALVEDGEDRGFSLDQAMGSCLGLAENQLQLLMHARPRVLRVALAFL